MCVTEAKVHPHVRVLSRVLWDMAVDGLLNSLNRQGYYTQDYDDNIVIHIMGKYAKVASELMQKALN